MEIKIDTEFIKLSSLLKLARIIQSGGESKHFMLENEVTRNGIKITERGKKIFVGDTIIINNSTKITVI